MISLTNHDYQGSVEQWGRDQIYPDSYIMLYLPSGYLT